jgi:hypothetical protein
MEEIKSPSQPWYKSDLAFLAGLALLKLLIHIPILTRYSYHHDELYFIACGQHLSFGYVDHAPLVPWLARLSTTLFGESLFGLRIFSMLSGAAAVFLVGLLVRRLGGNRFAQAAAGLGMLIAPVYLRTGNMLCIPAFEPLFWVLASYVLVRIIQEDNPKLWLWMGVIAGTGLMNKHSMLFFGLGLVIGLLLTPLRKHFKSPWLYAGAAIAFLIFLPNLIWQITEGWPTLNFLLNLNEGVMSGISLLQFLAGQLLYLHPFNAVLWISGLVFFFFKKAGKPYRILGWIWLSVFILLVVTKSKIYYLAPAYPALIAGGGIALERWVLHRGRVWLKPAALAALVIGGVLMGPMSVPILNINATEKYIHTATFGAFKNIYELTADLRGMFGWKKRLETVANVYHSLPPEEQKHTVILAAGYGNAGAVDYLGKAYGLPRAVSLSMNYRLWGLPEGPIETVIGMDFDKETMGKIFYQVELAAEVRLENVNSWQNPFMVTIGRKPKKPLTYLWNRNCPW